MHGIYASACSNDLDLHARSHWVGRGKNQYLIILTTKQVISIELATTVGHFYMALSLKTFIWLAHLVGCFVVGWLVGSVFWGIVLYFVQAHMKVRQKFYLPEK